MFRSFQCFFLFSLVFLAAGRAQDWRAKLPEAQAIVQEGGRVELVAAGQRFDVTGVDDRENPLISTPSGAVAVDRHLIVEGRLDSLRALLELTRLASAEGLVTRELVFQDDSFFRAHLRGQRALVLPEGVLEQKTTAITATPRVDLAEALKTTRAALARSDFASEEARHAIASVIHLIDHPEEESDTLSAAFARRLVRNGWLRPAVGESAAPLEEALRASEALTLATEFRREGMRYEVLKSASGRRVEHLVTPVRSALRFAAKSPHYHDAPSDVDLVLRLKAKAAIAPLNFEDVAAATLVRGPQVLAHWTQDGGFTAEPEAWRQTFAQTSGPRGSKHLLADAYPPHLLITDPEDRLLALITDYGIVPPPSGDATDFLDRAAKALPDAAHLDLLGQHYFAYVNDSPDPRFPQLVGTDDNHGEIHQTIDQTLATSNEGLCHGDCDDLAEIYHELARRQGRLAHILSLPGHAALLWVEQKEDGFHGYLLQTGPPMHFVGETLPKTLEAVYGAFGSLEAFDPDQVGISVRFAGENIRSNWVLSWRIFAEPQYAETMIDIQEDWHNHTFASAIEKTHALIEGGDDDPANHRELAGLYRSIGDWKAAAERQAIAMEKGGDPTLSLAISRVEYLLRAGEKAQAMEMAKSLFEKDFRRAARRQGPAFLMTAMSLIQVLASLGDDAALSSEIADRFLTPQLSRLVSGLSSEIERGNLSAADFNNSQELSEISLLLRGQAAVLKEILEATARTKMKPTAALERLVQSYDQWLRNLAFIDVELPGDTLLRFADAAAYYQAIMGPELFDQVLAAIPFPEEGSRPDAERRTLALQLRADLPWIKLSVPYYFAEIVALFHERHQTFDRERFDRLFAGFVAAEERIDRFGFRDFQSRSWSMAVRTLHALITEDDAALREQLRAVKASDDKILRDTLVTMCGEAARFIPREGWKRAMQAFVEEVDHAPSYFQIAWAARRGGAMEQAAIVADLALVRHGQRQDFVKERELLLAER